MKTRSSSSVSRSSSRLSTPVSDLSQQVILRTGYCVKQGNVVGKQYTDILLAPLSKGNLFSVSLQGGS